MKKLTAILLLVLFLFHLIGYRATFYLLEHHWQQEVELSLNNEEYNEADLITITVPLTLPYITDTKGFQRTDGQINVDGKIYRYVKSKVENGQYILRCLPDHYQQHLEKGKQNFMGYNNGVAMNNGEEKNPDSKTPVYKLPVTESDQHFFASLSQWSTSSANIYPPSTTAQLAYACHQSPEQPPDFFTL